MAIIETDISHVKSGRRAIAIMLAVSAVVVVIAVLWPSFDSMISIWRNDSTFAHGFLIPLLSGYAFWLKRIEFSEAWIQPSPIAVVVFLIMALTWYVAKIAGVQVLHQFAAIGMIGIAIWAVLGNDIARVEVFPLGYLLFMVPFGGFMVPGLMEFTADFTVAALKMTGIPVYRDGFFLTTANGSFEVAEACAGARYLLATVVLGVYFVWLEYKSWFRRILFMLVAFLVPIIANGIRAYIVVIVAHFSNMRYLVGEDHILFGQVLFGIFIIAMFFVGTRFSDRSGREGTRSSARKSSDASPPLAVAGASLAIIIVAGVTSVLAAKSETSSGLPSLARLPAAADGWQSKHELELEYSPKFHGQDIALAGGYTDGQIVIELNSIVYNSINQDSELVNQQNRLFDTEVWRLSTRSRGEISAADGRKIEFDAATLYRSAERLRVHSYYVVGNRLTAKRTVAKLFEIYELIVGRSSPRAFVAVATPVQLGQDSIADNTLSRFIIDHHDRFLRCLSGTGAAPGDCLVPTGPLNVPE
jgi:exosortase A